MEKVTSSIGNRKYGISWTLAIIVTYIHLAGVYGFYLFCFKAMWLTNLYSYMLLVMAIFGVTAGAHRLWAHKSYKARLPLRILLVILQTLALQFSVKHWVRLHRMHHKYSDTDADPHNVNRGIFFSHMGWLFFRSHPDYKAKLNTIDLSDITNDPVLRFQDRYYAILGPLVAIVLPTYIATLWGESSWNAYFVCAMFRIAVEMNLAFLINSAAHRGGIKPYDRSIAPADSKTISFLTLGEGLHNYHHTFPYDYKSAELCAGLNMTKLFIDFMAAIGWAYDLKTASTDLIQKRIMRTGERSHSISDN